MTRTVALVANAWLDSQLWLATIAPQRTLLRASPQRPQPSDFSARSACSAAMHRCIAVLRCHRRLQVPYHTVLYDTVALVEERTRSSLRASLPVQSTTVTLYSAFTGRLKAVTSRACDLALLVLGSSEPQAVHARCGCTQPEAASLTLSASGRARRAWRPAARPPPPPLTGSGPGPRLAGGPGPRLAGGPGPTAMPVVVHWHWQCLLLGTTGTVAGLPPLPA
jgi:hypothetical protein